MGVYIVVPYYVNLTNDWPWKLNVFRRKYLLYMKIVRIKQQHTECEECFENVTHWTTLTNILTTVDTSSLLHFNHTVVVKGWCLHAEDRFRTLHHHWHCWMWYRHKGRPQISECLQELFPRSVNYKPSWLPSVGRGHQRILLSETRSQGLHHRK